jgi:cathepsin C
MEARLKLKYGKQPPILSPQMLMTCNYMNEGCDGGWPHFNVFLAEMGHVVSEKCSPYKSKTKGDTCKNHENCPPIAKVTKSYFVGGGWGATSEKKMMKEILRNGPINGDFQAPGTFSIYKEGIFSEKGLLHLKGKYQTQ